MRQQQLSADLVVVGGGLAGCCCGITAARLGLKVVVIQDRPVPGGNASSEVRLWVLGATNHLTTNHRWSREGGLINEIMLENLWRNPEGNPVIFDTVLLEKLSQEANLTLLLNTAVYACAKDPADSDRISAVEAFCSQNSTHYLVAAPRFVDASGDGILGFLAGAAFRMGAEPREEFDEPFARGDDFGHLLGHSIYFYSKDTGRPVKYVAPGFALKNVPGLIPRYRNFRLDEYGCLLWWIEWGGRLDTIHDTEKIKWELWRIAYGVWDYIKNSGDFPQAETYTLEWVGLIPGKRESRRFEGDYILSQKDIIQRRQHDDVVAYGGWSIDLHPADGVYAKIAGSHHLHGKGIYGIPYRCFYSRNIKNLFLAGRIISSSHVAFGSTRVMATTAHGGQAVGAAAALCHYEGLLPRDLTSGRNLRRLQTELVRRGQHLPRLSVEDNADLARGATIRSSTEYVLDSLEPNADPVALKVPYAQLFPAEAGELPEVTVTLDADKACLLTVEWRIPSDDGHFTPDIVHETAQVQLKPGRLQRVTVPRAKALLSRETYVFLVLKADEGVAWHTTSERLSGVLSARFFREEDYLPLGGEKFEVFVPQRRPEGRNFAVSFNPPLRPFGAGAVVNGWQRPTTRSNAWVAARNDPAPTLSLEWNEPVQIRVVVVSFDPDYDHPLETVLRQHPERAVPFAVSSFRLLDDRGELLYSVEDYHQARCEIVLPEPTRTRRLTLHVIGTHGAPAAVFEVRVYSDVVRF